MPFYVLHEKSGIINKLDTESIAAAKRIASEKRSYNGGSLALHDNEDCDISLFVKTFSKKTNRWSKWEKSQ